MPPPYHLAPPGHPQGRGTRLPDIRTLGLPGMPRYRAPQQARYYSGGVNNGYGGSQVYFGGVGGRYMGVGEGGGEGGGEGAGGYGGGGMYSTRGAPGIGMFDPRFGRRW
jgi:hypothetical protein